MGFLQRRDGQNRRDRRRSGFGRLRRVERLQPRLMMAGDLQSPYQPLDVDLDLRVSRQDAEQVLNVLNNRAPEETLANGLFPDVTGDGLTTPLDALRIINRVHRGTPVVCAKLTHDSAFAGSNFDLLTNDPGIEIWSSAPTEQLELTLNGTTYTDLSDHVVDGRVLLPRNVLDSLASTPLADGEHLFEIGFAGQQPQLDFVVTVDRTPPEAKLVSDEGLLRQQTRELALLFGEPILAGSLQVGDFSLQTMGDPFDESTMPIALTPESSDRIKLRFEGVLRNAEYRLALPDSVSDAAGNAISSTEILFSIRQSVFLDMNPESQFITIEADSRTLSVRWDAAVQQAVAVTSSGPTIGSRAYAMVHTAIYDAWSAYDPLAVSTRLADTLQRPNAENTEANKSEAMSHAAYRVLVDLFPEQQSIFDEVMAELGYDADVNSANASIPAEIGQAMADALLSYRHQDGANQLGDSPDGAENVSYSDTTAYDSVNRAGETLAIDRWTPEFVPIDGADDSANQTQQFLTPQWGKVLPFALATPAQFRPPAPQPFLLGEGSVDLENRTITVADGTTFTIDRSLIGTVINPEFIAQAEQVVTASADLMDEQKLIAEFWEDAGGTSFPPGTWMSFGQFVSARDEHSLDDDAKLFFALSNAVFDAGVATWEAKVHYDYARPVRVIRELGRLGLIGELDTSRGGYVIDAWTPEGIQPILASDFLTYQTPGSHPSPPFAEYTSGHSSFSAAGATILELFSGQDAFGGEVVFEAGQSRFEPQVVPAESLTLRWETFREAADEAGLSRIYGGIHFSEGDLRGRRLGDEVGLAVWERTQQYVLGTFEDAGSV